MTAAEDETIRISNAFLKGEPLTRWARYSSNGEHAEFLIQFLDGNLLAPFLRERATAGKPVTMLDAEDTAFLAEFVHDWRGLEDETGEPLPFDREQLRAWMRRESSFGLWVVNTASAARAFYSGTESTFMGEGLAPESEAA